MTLFYHRNPLYLSVTYQISKVQAAAQIISRVKRTYKIYLGRVDLTNLCGQLYEILKS